MAQKPNAIVDAMISTENFQYQHDKADPQTGAIPLTAESTAQLLQDMLGHVENQTLAFDLDSTLLNNRPRNAVIMREFGETNNEPILCTVSSEHFEDWSAENTMRTLGLPEESIQRISGAYRRYWQKRFFTSEYCQHDIAIPGATEFVTAVRDNGGTVCYLTGRHEGMRAGTHKSLTKLGFPIPGTERVELVMKPQVDESDDEFKAQTLQKLVDSGPVYAAFDNEPTHINSYRTAFPDAVCIHLLTDHSMRDIALMETIVSILNFSD